MSFYEIVHGIFIGDGESSLNPPSNIKRIINCAKEYEPSVENNDKYLHIPLSDYDDEDEDLFESSIETILMFITKYDKSKSNILIHCHKGSSRSLCVAMVYLCYSSNLTVTEILKEVECKAPYIQKGYIYQGYLKVLRRIYGYIACILINIV